MPESTPRWSTRHQCYVERITSDYLGVSWHKRRGLWQVQIYRGGVRLHGGYYADEVIAAKAYDVLAVREFGDSRRLNFPEGAR